MFVFSAMLALAGVMPPKISCVVCPMALTGVVSVSPVTRHATNDKRNAKGTVSTLSQYGMPKVHFASTIKATSEISCPAMNHEVGVSIASISLTVWPSVRENSFVRLLMARIMLRHCMAKENRPEVTMQAAPPQSVHCTRSRKPDSWMTP